jgi:hypothetical protein
VGSGFEPQAPHAFVRVAVAYSTQGSARCPLCRFTRMIGGSQDLRSFQAATTQGRVVKR